MQWLGFAGGLMVAFGFVPQIIKAWQTRSTESCPTPSFATSCTAHNNAKPS